MLAVAQHTDCGAGTWTPRQGDSRACELSAGKAGDSFLDAVVASSSPFS